MEVHDEQLCSCLTGALRIQKKDGMLYFDRLTAKQREVIWHPESLLPNRADASAGMQIDFVTDAAGIALEYEAVLSSGGALSGLDLYVDGSLYYHQKHKDEAKLSDTLTTQLPAGRKRITIYLSCLYAIRIKRLSLDGASVFEPVKKEEKLLFLGDSITQGYVTEFPSFTYPNLLGAARNAEILNQALGGYVFEHSFLDSTFPFVPDRIFVAYGTNDWSGKRDISKEASAFFRRMSEIWPETPVFILPPFWRSDIEQCEAEGRPPFWEIAEQLRNACAPYPNMQIADIRDALPPYSEFYSDFIHPNTLGFTQIASALERFLR